MIREFNPNIQWDSRKPHKDTVYSDTLLTLDREKHDRLCKKHFGNDGQSWYSRKPGQIQAFLREYLDLPELILCKVEQFNNISDGFPIWLFYFA